jgi:SAM-dependent methyltransferase
VPSDIYTDGTYLASNPEWHAADSQWKADQCRRLLSQLHLSPASIADVGCGAGGVIAELGRSYPNASLAGFDPSEAALEMARSAHPEIDFVAGDIEGHYDLVLVMDVVEHVEDCFGLVRSLKAHADTVLFHIPLELSAYYLWRNLLMENRRMFGHLHYFTRETALALLTDAGYEILGHRYTASYVDHAAADLKSRIIAGVQRTGFRLAPDLSTVLLGGYSLMVAARPRAAAT